VGCVRVYEGEQQLDGSRLALACPALREQDNAIYIRVKELCAADTDSSTRSPMSATSVISKCSSTTTDRNTTAPVRTAPRSLVIISQLTRFAVRVATLHVAVTNMVSWPLDPMKTSTCYNVCNSDTCK
jgi:hypothetical protein